MLSRQQTQNQLDPKYWAIYGTLLGNTISSVINNPIVVDAGFKLPYAGYPTNLQLQQALRPYPQFSERRQQRGRPERRPLDIPRAGDQLRASILQGSVPAGVIHVRQADLDDQRRGCEPHQPRRGAESVRPTERQGCGEPGYAAQPPRQLHLRPARSARGRSSSRTCRPSWRAFSATGRYQDCITYVSGTPLWMSCNQTLFGAGQNQRCNFAPGVSTGEIPLINPAWTWNHDNIGTGRAGKDSVSQPGRVRAAAQHELRRHTAPDVVSAHSRGR